MKYLQLAIDQRFTMVSAPVMHRARSPYFIGLRDYKINIFRVICSSLFMVLQKRKLKFKEKAEKMKYVKK